MRGEGEQSISERRGKAELVKWAKRTSEWEGIVGYMTGWPEVSYSCVRITLFYWLDLSNLAPGNLTTPKFRRILCTIAVLKLTAISVWSSNNSSLTNFLPAELTQPCLHVLARQIYKANKSLSFGDFRTR